MTNLRNLTSILLSSFFLNFSAFADPGKPLEISRVTPQGEDVAAGQQIVFQFNQPVVPVGVMERDAVDIPITIQPAVTCQWRWLNTSALACQLDEKAALKPATRYQITVRPGITSDTGKTLATTAKYTFTTIRPAVSHTAFKTWRAPGMPQIRVRFNQAVTQASLSKHLYFQRPDAQRIAVVVERPPEEENEPDENEMESEDDNKPVMTTSEIWLVSPNKLLPLDTTMTLNVEPGLISEIGPEPGIEKREIVQFQTFPKFEFLGIKCADLKDQEVIVSPGDSANLQERCDPMRQVALLFSSPVIKEVVEENLLLTPDLAGGRTDYDPWEQVSSYSQLNNQHQKGEHYPVWLPALLKAYNTYQLKILNPDLFKDEFGRSLSAPVDMQFATDHRLPHYVFEHSNSVLEKAVDSEVPIFVTNLQKLDVIFQRLTDAGWSAEIQKTLTIPTVQDIAFKIPFGIRKLIPEDSGIVRGTFVTTPRVAQDESEQEYKEWFFSQITPFYVQVKVGHFNTLVWVTDFASGLPVADVAISAFQDVYSLQSQFPKDLLAKAVTNADGIALLPGTVDLDPKLEQINSYDREKPHLFIRCQKDKDVALLSLDSEFNVEMYDVLGGDYSLYPVMQPKYGHIHTWGTTAQGIYKVGDTLQFKLFVRDQDNKRFVQPPRKGYSLKVFDPTGKEVYTVPELTLNSFGAYSGEFQIPKTAAVGWYRFELKAAFTEQSWEPMQVLVSDFTPSPFRVRTVLNGELFKIKDTVRVNTFATLHAGGPYTSAPTRVNATLVQQDFEPKHPQTKGFQFDVYVEDANDDTVFQTEDKVNDKGELQTSFTLPDSSAVLYGQLQVESAVRDDRGKDVANVTTANYVGRDRFVGLKETSWLLTAGEPAKVNVIVVDALGNPVSATEVKVSIEYRETKAARVKGAGNAYLTQYQHEWVEKSHCAISSALTPQTCTFTPPKAGTYRVTARIHDTQGGEHKTELQQWATGKEWVMWETSADNALEIVPEQTSYRVGETARYLVKNPYPGAKALITVERFGILKSWVKTFTQSTEVVDIPVEADYIPGFFVSVVVMSPRVDKPLDENQVDLGKPAFRMGYVKTTVEDPYKTLTVAISTDKPLYKPREQVTVDLQVNATQKTEEPIELAVTVLDEAVFDLLTRGRDYFDPYKGFYTLDDLDMGNFSLLMRLVGRQKFEKKGANAGGDGGIGLGMRSLFKFVSYWNPSLQTDAEGKAKIQFTVPDNLTGWRVLALAVTPTDRMGLGDANFKVNQPIEIRPALPNQVLSGDSFHAGFNIMNRTEQSQTLNVVLDAKGPVELTACPPALTHCGAEQSLTAEPYKRYTLWLPLKTTGSGEIQLSAQAKSPKDQDGLRQNLTVYKRRVLETTATYGTTIADTVTEKVAFPKEIDPESGGLKVIVTPTVLGNLDGAFTYIRGYPYACWEQKLTKGTMANHYQNLRDYLTLSWKESEALAQKTLKLATEYQAPNGGMAFFVAQDDRVSPYLSAYTALAFNWLRDSGHDVPNAVENKLHEYLSTVLRQEVMPDFYSQGLASSVRAVALAALAKQGKVTRSDLKRYEPAVKQMDLFGKSQYLSAAVQIPKTQTLQAEVVDMLLAQADQTAGKITFSETLEDGYKQILTSSLRTQCSILQSLLDYKATSDKDVGDLPFKLARTIVQSRGKQGHWENTQETMFCMNALTTFARQYETEKPELTVRSLLNTKPLAIVQPKDATGNEAHFNDVKNPAVTFSQDMTPQLLGSQGTVKLERQGQGRLYYTVRLSYVPNEDKATAVNSGIEVKREYHVERQKQWHLLESPMKIKSGELVRVDLYVSVPAARHFVVVDDPVPGGLEPVNRDLATASTVDADKAGGVYAGGSWWFKFNDWQEFGISQWNFYHQELRHHAARFYADYLPAGHYHLAYVAQAIAPGEFGVQPAHAEEMYEPEVFGKSTPVRLNVTRDSGE